MSAQIIAKLVRINLGGQIAQNIAWNLPHIHYSIYCSDGGSGSNQKWEQQIHWFYLWRPISRSRILMLHAIRYLEQAVCVAHTFQVFFLQFQSCLRLFRFSFSFDVLLLVLLEYVSSATHFMNLPMCKTIAKNGDESSSRILPHWIHGLLLKPSRLAHTQNKNEISDRHSPYSQCTHLRNVEYF